MDIKQSFINEITQHQGIIHKICCIYLEDKADREDLFQEIILQSWKSYPNFRRDSKFQTWLYRIALNTAITHHKRSKREQQSLVELSNELETFYFPVENEEMTIMFRAIKQLTKVEKAIVALYLEDYSYTEIAESIGTSPNNIAVKISRIKIKLKHIIKNIA